MYFKISIRKNPETKKLSGYYRLVESYRNHNGNVCVRTLLSAGFLDDLNPELQKFPMLVMYYLIYL